MVCSTGDLQERRAKPRSLIRYISRKKAKKQKKKKEKKRKEERKKKESKT
jgi:hypothetical protein